MKLSGHQTCADLMENRGISHSCNAAPTVRSSSPSDSVLVEGYMFGKVSEGRIEER